MHPFLPALSLILMAMADGMALFLRLNRSGYGMEYHAPAIRLVIFTSLLFGAGLALWFRRFGIRFPTWIAILSLVFLGVLGLA